MVGVISNNRRAVRTAVTHKVETRVGSNVGSLNGGSIAVVTFGKLHVGPAIAD